MKKIVKNSGVVTDTHVIARTGMTLLEIILGLTIMGVIFAAILPQFRLIFNTWESRQTSSEIFQNARILMEHLSDNISTAVRITNVSPAAQANGFIEFKNTADTTMRYDIVSGTNYVQFGAVGALSELAGPVNQLQFTCYDACDLVNPTTDVTKIRMVKAAATFTNPNALGQNKSFTTEAWLRTNYQEDDGTWGIGKASLNFFEFDTSKGASPALCQIDSTHYLCAYEESNGDGWAVVLNVNTSNWTVSRYTPYEFDGSTGQTPFLSQIDSTHYLCAYEGGSSDGWAVVLEINPATWTISDKTPFEFDDSDGLQPCLAKIDSTHYLCAYRGPSGDGWSVVLQVNTVNWQITMKTPFEFDSSTGYEPALAQIDATHFLCTYRGPSDDGWSAVLEINMGTWNITRRSSFEFDTVNGLGPAVIKIDTNHYLCTYSGPGDNGVAAILNVNTSTWAITKQFSYEFDSVYCLHPSLTWMTGNHYVCSYSNNISAGVINSLWVRTDNWTIGTDGNFVFDSVRGREPDVLKIDSNHCLVAYRGPADDGWSGVVRVGVPVLP